MLFRVFMAPVLFSAAQGSWHDKASEKQVAMIAQKVMDANQTQDQRRPFIPAPDLGTSTFRALLTYHCS
jgi:hypothetical protein